MAYCKRIDFLFSLLLFCLFANVSPAQDTAGPVDKSFGLRIVINGDSVLSSRNKNIGPGETHLIPGITKSSIIFKLPALENYEYQFFLKGFDSGWSAWTKRNSVEYASLPKGVYLFQSRIRYPGNPGQEVPSYSFRVTSFRYLPPSSLAIYAVILVLIILSFYLFLKFRFDRKQAILEQLIERKNEELKSERIKREALLTNVLPKKAADEIMALGKTTKVKYNFVTVLFSDIQGFTRIAEETNPELLIDELDKFFFYFDSVVEKYGIEKIKTIGDAYMCAGGIPEKNRTNPVEVILAALEMKDYMSRLKLGSELEGMKFWDIRIGIHTGTVIAGVVGQRKLSFDIWGDTVNTASRMESSGDAGKINISGTTYEFVKEFFDCEYRGRMPVKYKGELEMYFVTGIIPELCDESGRPNRKFIVRMQKIKLQDIEDLVIKMFDDEAPPDLYFHNSSLVKNVISQVDLLSHAENIGEEDYINLKLASLFLLTGYLTDYEKPMEVSIRLLEEILPRYGFPAENIDVAVNIIKNSFADRQEGIPDYILHDALYDYLGRVDYVRLTDKLLRELTEYGRHVDRTAWIELQKKQLFDHQFMTNTARLLRSVSAGDQVAALIASSE
jgi:adenylate cyclase